MRNYRSSKSPGREELRSGRRIRVCLAAAGVVVLAGSVSVSWSQLIPSFPGADGAAATASGGRGGIVYHVTSVASAIDDPARNDYGTIRYGLNNANFPVGVPRTIVFDVGGVFNLGRLPQPANNWLPNGNGWDAQSRLTIGGTNITLAGQTAPSPVIFMGGGLKPQGNNNVIRNITVASGYGLSGWWSPGNPMPAQPGTGGASTDPAQWFPDNTVYDAMDIAGTNLMIDHVSTLYATDETISMNEVANNITVQYSNISQGQNYPQWDAEGGGLTGHALGSLLEAGNTTQAAISFHHNLYAHQKARVPQLQAGQSGAFYDFRNNVFYNWFGTAGSKSGSTSLNLVNNFYLAGDGGDNPIGGTNPGINQQGGGTGVLAASSSIYRNGNLLDSNKDADANDGVALPAGGAAAPLWRSGTPTYGGITDSAAQTYDRVLNYMGANWWMRDGVIDTPDERIINEARTGTGKIMAWADDPWNADPAEGAEWRALVNTAPVYRAFNWDGDQDGLPAYWETAHGLSNGAQNNNGDFDGDGYTNLEEYLNEVAAWPAPVPLVFDNSNTTARYEEIRNWNIDWQPSRFDEARIDSGSVTINSVGQHAGTLSVAHSPASTATLSVSAGWIDVASTLRVGAGGNGFLVQTGGIVNAGVGVIVGNNGGSISTYTLAGGTLMTSSLQLVGGGRMILTPGADKLLRVNSLAIDTAAGSKLDLGDNDMIVDYASGGSSPETQLQAWITDARNGGAWDGTGITSDSARTRVDGATTLGVLSAGEYFSVYGPGATFDGQTIDESSVLVKYTWYGDTDFNGSVDFDDYVRVDGGFNAGLSGWLNGDADASGAVDFDDYVLVDLSFNAQNGTLRRAQAFLSGDDRSMFGMNADPALQKVVEHFAEFGIDYATHFLSAIPEPGTAIATLLLVSVISRRRERSTIRARSVQR